MLPVPLCATGSCESTSEGMGVESDGAPFKLRGGASLLGRQHRTFSTLGSRLSLSGDRRPDGHAATIRNLPNKKRTPADNFTES